MIGICFECQRMEVYINGDEVAVRAISNLPEKETKSAC